MSCTVLLSKYFFSEIEMLGNTFPFLLHLPFPSKTVVCFQKLNFTGKY